MSNSFLTIFTSVRPFNDPHIATIQRNAIKSWTLLRPKCEIIILGDEEGVKEIAKDLDIIHISGIKKNTEGKPLKSEVFKEAIKRASSKLICFVNGDIILMDDFLKAAKKVASELPSFLMAGRRYDVDIVKPIDFNDPLWNEHIRTKTKKEGKLHGPAALDYVVFPKNIDLKMPPFAMNRGGWDNWIIFRFKSLGIPVIDATESVLSIHQNHPLRIIKNLWIKNPLAREELKKAGGFSSFLTLRDADLLLTRTGLKRPPFFRFMLSKLAFLKVWRLLLAFKRIVWQYI